MFNSKILLMESLLRIDAVQELASRPYTDRNGQPAVMHTRTILLSDGIDSFTAELVGGAAQGLNPQEYPTGTFVYVVLRFRYQRGREINTFFQSVQIDRLAKAW